MPRILLDVTLTICDCVRLRFISYFRVVTSVSFFIFVSYTTHDTRHVSQIRQHKNERYDKRRARQARMRHNRRKRREREREHANVEPETAKLACGPRTAVRRTHHATHDISEHEQRSLTDDGKAQHAMPFRPPKDSLLRRLASLVSLTPKGPCIPSRHRAACRPSPIKQVGTIDKSSRPV